MNINILINRLQNDEREFDDVWISDADAKVIVALLEAGQALRNILPITHWNEFYTELEPVDDKVIIQAALVYDAATKEEDV